MLGLLLCSINFDTLTFVTKLSLNLPTDQKLTFLIAAGILFHKNFAFALQKKHTQSNCYSKMHHSTSPLCCSNWQRD